MEPTRLTKTSSGAAADGGPLFVVVSGPSCAGKDSVLAGLQERQYPAHFTVTATTRPERDGDSFIRHMGESEFTDLLQNNGLLEIITPSTVKASESLISNSF